MCDFDKDDVFEKGQQIQMIGKLISMSNKIYFEVLNSGNIKKLNGQKLDDKVLRGVLKTPKRKASNKENSSQELNRSLETKVKIILMIIVKTIIIYSVRKLTRIYILCLHFSLQMNIL